MVSPEFVQTSGARQVQLPRRRDQGVDVHPQLYRLLFDLLEKDTVEGVHNLALSHEVLCDEGDYCGGLREDEDGGVDPCERPVEKQEDRDLREVQEGKKEGESDNGEDEKGEDAGEERGKEGRVADKV